MENENKYQEWRCPGVQKNGKPCNQRLLDYNPKVETDISIKCPKCNLLVAIIRKPLE